MARGQKSAEGATRTAPNGYHYTKEGGKWRLTHHIIAERMLGRPLMSWERVLFKDKDRTNLKTNNLQVVDKGGVTWQQKIAYVDAQIAELQKLRDELEASANA